jgi:hypothetical protein
MSFINPVWFKADLPKTAVMDLIARTPPNYFYLVPAGDDLYYGMFLAEDGLEYLTNEFTVRSLKIVASDEVKNVLALPGCKVWGNQELIDF